MRMRQPSILFQLSYLLHQLLENRLMFQRWLNQLNNLFYWTQCSHDRLRCWCRCHRLRSTGQRRLLRSGRLRRCSCPSTTNCWWCCSCCYRLHRWWLRWWRQCTHTRWSTYRRWCWWWWCQERRWVACWAKWIRPITSLHLTQRKKFLVTWPTNQKILFEIARFEPFRHIVRRKRT